MINYNIEDNGLGEKNLICVFPRRLDTNNCIDFESALIEKIEESKIPVVFDLEEVEYVASSFLSICLRVFKKMGAENFSIINVRPPVKKVFKIAKFDKTFSIS